MDYQALQKLHQLNASPRGLDMCSDATAVAGSQEQAQSQSLMFRCCAKKPGSDEQCMPVTSSVNVVDSRQLSEGAPIDPVAGGNSDQIVNGCEGQPHVSEFSIEKSDLTSLEEDSNERDSEMNSQKSTEDDCHGQVDINQNINSDTCDKAREIDTDECEEPKSDNHLLSIDSEMKSKASAVIASGDVDSQSVAVQAKTDGLVDCGQDASSETNGRSKETDPGESENIKSDNHQMFSTDSEMKSKTSVVVASEDVDSQSLAVQAKTDGLVDCGQDTSGETNGRSKETDPGESEDTKSGSHHKSLNDRDSEVKPRSGAVFASRDIRFYNRDDTRRPSSKRQQRDGQWSGKRRDKGRYGSNSTASRRSKNGQRSDSDARSSGTNGNCTLFVANLSYKVTQQDLYYYLTQFGAVEDCHVVKNHHTRKSKGFGFVTFCKEETAERALNSPPEKRTLDGRLMRFDRAEPKKQGLLAEASRGVENGPKPSTPAVVVDASDCHITVLPDEVLVKIFLYLGIKERVKIEEVCHRWRSLALESWKALKHLSFLHTFSVCKGHVLTDRVFHAILQRGCCELRSVDLSACPHNLSDFAISLIAIKCQKLTRLDISGVSVSPRCFRKLTEDCKTLQWIRLQRCHRLGEKAMWWLCHNCSNLQYIDIGSNTRLTGQCFYVLGGQLSTAHLRGCSKLTDKGIELLASRSPNLEELDISSCSSITDNGIQAITSNCVQLKRLVFQSCNQSVTPYGLFGLSKLLFLERLDMRQNSAVNDYVLGAIAGYCNHLCELDVSACRGGITDAGIQCLVGCVHLSNLDISYLTDVTADGVSHLAQIGTLKKLIARYCTGITTEGFISVVSLCELEELDVSSCFQLGDFFLEKVIAVKPPTSRLLLTVGGTTVTDEGVEKFGKSDPTVELSLQSLAHGHLIPDRDLFYPLYDDEDDDEDEDKDEDEDEEFGGGLEEEANLPMSTPDVLSGNMTAAGTFDDAIVGDDAEEELDDVGQYCEDFLENDDPSLFPEDGDEWMFQS